MLADTTQITQDNNLPLLPFSIAYVSIKLTEMVVESVKISQFSSHLRYSWALILTRTTGTKKLTILNSERLFINSTHWCTCAWSRSYTRA